MYFVTEWNTISAPSVNGFETYGDRNVLSTTIMIFGLISFAIREISPMSTRLNVGFEGDSTHTAFVSLRKSSLSFSGFDKFANVVSSPLCLATLVIYRCVP